MGLKSLVKKLANTKIAGVSLAGMAGAATNNPLIHLAGQKARGGSLKDNVLGDLKGGVRNAAVIAPLAGAGAAASAGAEPGRFRQLAGFFKDNASTIADYGGMAEGIYDRYQQNKQYGDARKAWDEAAPLRQAAMAGLMDTSRPDVSSIFADPTNPQGRYRAVGVGSRGRV